MLGFPHIHYASTDSTNTRALALAQNGAPAGTTVSADYQSSGRGRQGRDWIMPPGSGLLLSVLLRDPPELLALRAGLAVAQTIAAQTDRKPSLKWPNDVLIDGSKVSGILVQGRPQEGLAVVGIGINTSLDTARLPEDVASTAATLSLSSTESRALLPHLLRALAEGLESPDDLVISSFNSLDSLHGKAVSWEGGTGTAAGIGRDGSLQVLLAGGHRTSLSAGEVHLGGDAPACP